MELYNCESPREKELKETELTGLTDCELEKLADEIYEEFEDCELEDETIVINALHQIAQEALERLCIQKALKTKFINIGLNIDGDING